MTESFDWSLLAKQPEACCYCVCGNSFWTHAISFGYGFTSEKPCPSCGRTIGFKIIKRKPLECAIIMEKKCIQPKLFDCPECLRPICDEHRLHDCRNFGKWINFLPGRRLPKMKNHCQILTSRGSNCPNTECVKCSVCRRRYCPEHIHHECDYYGPFVPLEIKPFRWDGCEANIYDVHTRCGGKDKLLGKCLTCLKRFCSNHISDKKHTHPPGSTKYKPSIARRTINLFLPKTIIQSINSFSDGTPNGRSEVVESLLLYAGNFPQWETNCDNYICLDLKYVSGPSLKTRIRLSHESLQVLDKLRGARPKVVTKLVRWALLFPNWRDKVS